MKGPATALEPDTAAFLTSGCSLIVGVVLADGSPYATRGWGLTLLPGERLSARLLLAAEDTVAIQHLSSGSRVAITAASVRTYRALQFKGRSLGVQPASDEDRACGDRHTDAYFTAVVETDALARHLCERLGPEGYVACVLTLDELYDQTPGPGAGAPLDRPGP